MGQVNESILCEWAGEFFDAWEAAAKAKKKATREKRAAFVPPTPEEARAYALSIGFRLDGQRFCAHYTSVGWKVGKNPMIDWKAAVVTWKSSAEPRDLFTPETKVNGHNPEAEPVGWREWGIAHEPDGIYWRGVLWENLPARIRAKVLAEMPKP